MRNLLGACLLLLLAGPGHAAVVGTLNAQGDQLTIPLAFDKPVFNSTIDLSGGLSFAIAPGASGPVKLDILEGTKNIQVVAAAIGSAFGIAQGSSLSIVSESLSAGVHPFAIGTVAPGAKGSAIIARLTLTPLPGSLFLLASALSGLALAARRFR
jgi:hypothetical protein